MEKFKNFIYDKSDLLVALLIVAIAGLVIWFGIHNIMSPIEEDSNVKTSTQVSDSTTDSGVASDGKFSQDDNLEQDKKSTSAKEAKIIISSGEGNDQVAEKLLASGAISDKSVFLSKLEEMNLATKVNEGTFTIPAGSTLEEICRIITRT